ncbi:D-alanyl-D-alanine carboxypeptidase [Streptomyces sp. Amel2xC10]|uniref:D-alanyl-D-alanine carboxypeptidase n=1 Tax=Streptomyces sp. Amel2xC10 TaxID=1305826 RepID=UPI000A088A7A|nr:D-alanyl-D-alanine carboxypeptidase [Streptomyces sp. Amel2xC10]SMF57438.1 D-alanyl-D-alanine carboxypeptidase [Streptomyces sp. Amel2xC10]
MAGESPDRSKQRESSAEPTSGSAGTVPESREPRDPRLAVARDSDPPRGGVDTATRVFAVRELEIERDAEAATGVATGEPTGGSADGAEGEPSGDGDLSRGSAGGRGAGSVSGSADGSGEESGSGSADGSGGGVTDRSADGLDDEPIDGPSDESTGGVTGGLDDEPTGEVADEATEDPTGTAGDAADGAAGNATARDAGDDDASGDAGAATADAGIAAAGTASGGTTADSDDARNTPARSAGDDVTGDADDATADTEEATGAGDVTAGAVDEDAADARSATPRAASDDVTRDSGDATADADGDAVGAAGGAGRITASDADDARSTTTGAMSDDATRDLGNATAGAEVTGDSASRDADAASADADAATADAEETTEAEGTQGAEEGPEGASEGPGGSEGGSDASGGSEGADGGDERLPAAVAQWATPAKPAGKPGADADEADAKTDAGEAGAKPDTAGAKAAPKWADSTPVDQPTAVFKAPRPKPAVDQPTTMLKLGGATKPEETDKPEAPAPAPAPAPDQRTSRFVALKPDVTAHVPQIGPERTTQQPLPPKPPLDLLAELTNTPPPPPTPLRTLGRRIKIWTPLVVLLLVVFAIAQAVRPLPATALELTAKDSYTFEGGKLGLPWPKEGQGAMDVNGIGTMDAFGDEKPVAIGSVAKAMTAYVVLKDHPLKSGEEGPAIPVDATAEKEGGYDKDGESTLNTVKEGDTLTERQALSAIMIPSANNIARLLARWDAGTEAEFIQKMNDTAKELGMTNTTYTDASGLKETTVSTAADQVKLGNALVKIPALVEITRLPEWIDPSGQKWRNYNTLVPYNNAIGIKTGSTSKAGGNLLFAATKESGGETVTVVGAILGQHTAPIIDTVNAVSKTALLAAQDAITSAKILKKGDVVGYVDDQLGGRTPVVVTKDVAAVGWAGLTVKLSFAADEVPHTAKAGTQVGTLTVGDGASGAVKVPVALQSDLAEPGFSDKLTRIT